LANGRNLPFVSSVEQALALPVGARFMVTAGRRGGFINPAALARQLRQTEDFQLIGSERIFRGGPGEFTFTRTGAAPQPAPAPARQAPPEPETEPAAFQEIQAAAAQASQEERREIARPRGRTQPRVDREATILTQNARRPRRRSILTDLSLGPGFSLNVPILTAA